VVTIRLNSAKDHVIRPTQTTFMQGRYILDGVVTLHETVHKLHHKNRMRDPKDRLRESL
jgi:hypothetical protein